MALKDDELLKELDEKLALHCKEKEYTFVVSIMAEDTDEGVVTSCNGKFSQLGLDIVAFANNIERNTNFRFKEFLVRILEEEIRLCAAEKTENAAKKSKGAGKKFKEYVH